MSGSDVDWGEDDEGDEDWGDGGDEDWGNGEEDFPPAEDDQEVGFSVDLKNAVWQAEAEDDPESALALYLKVINMGSEKPEELNDELHNFVFDALTASTISFYQMKKYEDMLSQYDKTMNYFGNVTHNECDKAVEKILGELERGTGDEKASDIREKVFERTIKKLENMPDKKRMLFGLQMNQAVQCVGSGQFDKAKSLLKTLHQDCTNPDGTDDQTKGSELIDIYALQMRMAGEQSDMEVTKELYEKTKGLNADVKNPKSQSIIRECWGKMWGDDGNWQKAYQDFYLAFTTYQEAGMGTNAKQCLTYVIVSNMLSGGNANPFDAREAQVFQNDPKMEPVINIRKAKEKRDVDAFARALHDFDKTWGDKWIKRHMETMIADFHKSVILQFVRSYRMLRIQFLADALRISAEKCEWYLVQMILDGDVIAKIDQVEGILDLSQSGGGGGKKYHAMQVWAGTLSTVSRNLPQPQTTNVNVMGGMHSTFF